MKSITLILVSGFSQSFIISVNKVCDYLFMFQKSNFIEESLDIHPVFSSRFYPFSSFKVGAMMIKS